MGEERSNFEAARAFAEFGLDEKNAGRRESASGPGSSRAAAEQALHLLRRTIRNRRIRSVLDLGCGDWHWMRDLGLPHLDRGLDVSYEGWDASERLIGELNGRHGSERIVFRLRDITTAPLPKVDLIIARDVLFHLDIGTAAALVDKIRRSCRFFLSTSFPGAPENINIRSYLPIKGWGFHKINLDIPPFDLLESMVEAIREPHCAHSGNNRFVCLYEFG